MLNLSTLAVLGLASIASSHMIMNTPVPYGKSSLNNSPLLADGSDFPCKQRTGVYDAEGASNIMPIGSSQKLAFTGSATHGGGSCQISVTYDEAPTASSTWKVIHSIEGGCPIKNTPGNNGDDANAVDPDTFTFTIPDSLPTGTATLAWTWFNKIGNREMYMNCAPISITAGSTKRDVIDQYDDYANATMLMERDTAAFSALPDMLVANIPTSKCESVDSQDLKFPSPGDALELFGTATATPVAPTGPSCGVTATGSPGSSSKSSAASVAPTTAAASSKATATSKATSSKAASAPGGIFATVPAVSASSAPSVATSAPVASSASPVASSAAPASTPSTGTTGTGNKQTVGSACPTEGQWNCIGGSSYQQCASGTWSTVMEVAAGTTCASGESMSINITATGSKKNRRSVRFSNAHIRRHQEHRS